MGQHRSTMVDDDMTDYGIDEFLRQTIDIVFAVDRDWRLTYLNPCAEVFLRNGRVGTGAATLWDLAPELASCFYKPLRCAMIERVTVKCVGHYAPLEKWFEIRAYPVAKGLWLHLLDISDRKRSEDALRKSEHQYQMITANVPGIVYKRVRRPDGTLYFAFVSDGIRQICGIEPNDVTADPAIFIERVHPEDRDLFTDDSQEWVNKEEPWCKEFRIITLDGATKWVQATSRARRQANGDVVWEGILLDIDQRKTIEEELRKSEERFKDLAGAATDWIWEMDEQLRVSYLSDRFQELTGVAPEHILRKTRSEFVETEALDEQYHPHVDLQERRPFRDFRYTYRDVHGKAHHWSTSGVPVFDPQGKFLGYHGTGSDITAEIEAERALRDREKRLRGILENLTEAIITIRDDGIIESFYGAAENMFGYSSKEVVGQSIKILMPGPDRDRHDEYIRQHVVFGESKIIGKGVREVVAMRKDGSTFPAGLSISSMQFDDVRIFIGVMRDITARKQAEQDTAMLEGQLNQMHKIEALGTLAGGIAHDLNNMLVPILGLTEMALEDLPQDSPVQANMEQVVIAAERGKELVDRILAFSRKKEVNREAVVLSSVVREVMSLLRATLPSTIEIRERLDKMCIPVVADITQIHQVLMNLASNASDAMGMTPGILEIALDVTVLGDDSAAAYPELEPGRYAKLTVSDTGPGMDRATLERLFEPYFTTKPVGVGTGLGLSVVHGIIEDHWGAIRVHSLVGHGTTFEILLPADPTV